MYVGSYIVSCLSYNSIICWKIQERVAWRSLRHTQNPNDEWGKWEKIQSVKLSSGNRCAN